MPDSSSSLSFPRTGSALVDEVTTALCFIKLEAFHMFALMLFEVLQRVAVMALRAQSPVLFDHYNYKGRREKVCN